MCVFDINFDIVIPESVTISGDTPYVVYSDLFGGSN